MKKLIISAIATVSLLFGFASCSGDLHDDERRPIDLSGGYYLVGSMTGAEGWSNKAADVIAFEDAEIAGSYKVPFTADDSTVYFAFIPTAGSWNGQIGGDKMVSGTMPTNAKFSSKDNANGGFNGVIEGLEKASDYKLIVTPLDDGTLKIDCSSNVPPKPFYLNGYFISGSMNSGAANIGSVLSDDRMSVDTAKGYVTYYYDFNFNSTDNADWEQGNKTTTIAFGIRNATGDWSVKYVNAKYALGTDSDYVKCSTSGTNNIVTGLKDGNSYRIYVQTTPDKTVSFKVVQLNKVKLTVKVSDLPDILNGVDFYIRGDMNGWDVLDAYKATVTDNALSVSWSYTYEGTSVNQTYSCKFSIKPGAAGDRAMADGWGLQLSAADGANLNLEFTNTETLNYKYSGVSGKADENTCTYYVITKE